MPASKLQREFTSRLPDWEPRLRALVDRQLRQPHVYGQWDCLLWPAAAVKAVTGRDFGAGHRGKYKSRASAYRYLNSLGFTSPAELLDSLFDEKPVAFAGRSDLVLCDVENGPVPGVWVGNFALIVGEIELPEGKSFGGLIGVKRENCLKAWAVGEHHSNV